MSEVMQMIATYGVLPVLVAAVIVVAIWMFKSQNSFNKKQQELNEKQQEDNKEAEKRLVEKYDTILKSLTQVTHNTTSQHSYEEEESGRKTDELVNNYLAKLLATTGANRACCFLYHNGGKSVIGRSFQKMSLWYEQVDVVTTPIMRTYQQMPRMMFPVLNQKMAEQGYYYIENIEDIKNTDVNTYQSLKGHGTRSAFLHCLKATNGVISGFILVEFVANDYDPKHKKEITHCLHDKALKISSVLEVKGEVDIIKEKEEEK